ncbi:MAG: hypothetical protein CVU87_03740 [Firmicutes bacterium HGW-Firmicutes-12]|nr:MAG: hypothetical protein CVU87_03740 [Firmicutes bacterium HGW-Firmicutes-12]
MPKIHLLDNLTANQIAAGEVIERPASVVKELVENALDAGAFNISVDIKEGGLAGIQIVDDGCGMSKEDALLAIRRHATSKLNKIEDLNEIKTLGFRGEALPSITAVSQTEIITRERQHDYGTKISLAGNDILFVEPAGASAGTIITVSELFYNTPARKKFMRSSGYEGGLIHEMMIHFSLSHPQVSFRLIHQGKEVLNTRGIDTLPDLIEVFYGKEARSSLVTQEKEAITEGIQAFITAPGFHRANRKAIYFFINNRRVLTTELMRVLEKAYENLLPKARFPLAVIHMDLHPSLIDVNVHPGKLEIRFRDAATATKLAAILEQKLNNAAIIPNYSRNISTAPEAKKPSSATQEAFKDFYTWEQVSYSVREDKAEQREIVKQEIKTPPVDNKTSSEDETGIEDSYSLETDKLPFMRIIGQLDNTFILAEGEKGLYLIDQHAAHERIIFDSLIEQAKNGQLKSQVLLNPITLQLTIFEEEIVLEHILPLSDLGIILEHFGPRSYLLRAVPVSCDADPEDFFFELIERLSNRASKLTPKDIRTEYLITASCKGAIKAMQKLAYVSMDKLLRDLNATSNPLVCPHGRPVFILIPHHDILKAFHRK